MATKRAAEPSGASSFLAEVVCKFFTHGKHISTMLSMCNSPVLISIHSKMLNNPRMKTCKEIRHQNLLILIERSGTIQAFADKLGKSHAQISQIKNKSANSSTGKVRGIGDEQAREIEKKLELESGWMDHEHNENLVDSDSFQISENEQPYSDKRSKFKKIEELTRFLLEKSTVELDHLIEVIYSIDKYKNG